MVFKPENLDFNQSPYTGMTREHWIDAAKYLLIRNSNVSHLSLSGKHFVKDTKYRSLTFVTHQ